MYLFSSNRDVTGYNRTLLMLSAHNYSVNMCVRFVSLRFYCLHENISLQFLLSVMFVEPKHLFKMLEKVHGCILEVVRACKVLGDPGVSPAERSHVVMLKPNPLWAQCLILLKHHLYYMSPLPPHPSFSVCSLSPL